MVKTISEGRCVPSQARSSKPFISGIWRVGQDQRDLLPLEQPDGVAPVARGEHAVVGPPLANGARQEPRLRLIVFDDEDLGHAPSTGGGR